MHARLIPIFCLMGVISSERAGFGQATNNVTHSVSNEPDPLPKPVDSAAKEWAWSAGTRGVQVAHSSGQFVARLRGYAQFDSRVFLGESSPANTVLVRRLRPILEGSMAKFIDYRLMLDFAPSIRASQYNYAYVQDAFLNIRPLQEIQVQAGKFREPVGLERIQSDQNLAFVERAYPSQLVANRDLGVAVHGEFKDGSIVYETGVFNGQPDGTTGDINRDDSRDFAGRLFVQPFRNTDRESLRRLGLGVGGTVGEHTGATAGYVSPGQKAIFTYSRAKGSPVLEDGTVWRIIPQAYYYFGPLGLLSEYAVSSRQVRAEVDQSTGSLTHSAWQFALSYAITGEENSFLTVAPRHPITWGQSGSGAWLVAARISGIRFDEEAFPQFANPQKSARGALSYTAGLSWIWSRNVRWTLNYEHSRFDADSGAATFPRQEDVVIARLQVGL